MLKGCPSKCLARLTRPSLKKFAHLAAGHRLPAQLHLGINLDLETHLAPELGQHLHIACSLVAKMKVEAFMHFAGVQLFVKYFFRKLPRSHQR